jgi:hypothetical protein
MCVYTLGRFLFLGGTDFAVIMTARLQQVLLQKHQLLSQQQGSEWLAVHMPPEVAGQQHDEQQQKANCSLAAGTKHAVPVQPTCAAHPPESESMQSRLQYMTD